MAFPTLRVGGKSRCEVVGISRDKPGARGVGMDGMEIRRTRDSSKGDMLTGNR